VAQASQPVGLAGVSPAEAPNARQGARRAHVQDGCATPDALYDQSDRAAATGDRRKGVRT
jgi:hypothetical protein